MKLAKNSQPTSENCCKSFQASRSKDKS